MPLQDKTAEKMLNNVAEFIAATLAKPDQRAWDQLLIYCPQEALERRAAGYERYKRLETAAIGVAARVFKAEEET